MPIRNRDDAAEVEGRIARIFESPTGERGAAVRSLFVEVLDFDPASGQVDLGAAPVNVALPTSAERIASLGGVQVVYVALETSETDRVRKGEASAAAKRAAELLGDDPLAYANLLGVARREMDRSGARLPLWVSIGRRWNAPDPSERPSVTRT